MRVTEGLIPSGWRGAVRWSSRFSVRSANLFEPFRLGTLKRELQQASAFATA